MARFDSIYEYITDTSTDLPRLEKIEQCIDALLDSQLKMMGNADVKEIHFNDGQTVVKTIFRDFSDLSNAIKLLKTEKNEILMSNTGRIKQLITPNRAR